MVEVLSSPELYDFTGDRPPTLEELGSRYKAWLAGPATDDEIWHNWIIRLPDSRTAIGLVQATVTAPSADLAWLVGVAWQGNGYATEAATAMSDWLITRGVDRFRAHIHPGHVVSGKVATAIGLTATDESDEDGEIVWTSVGKGPPD